MLSPEQVKLKHRGRRKRFTEVAEMLQIQGVNLRVVDLTPNMQDYIRHGTLGSFDPNDPSVLLDEAL